MGQHLNAVVLKSAFDENLARSFDLRYRTLYGDVTIFFLTDDYVDTWIGKLNIHGSFSAPVLNFYVIHHMMNVISEDPLFAVIEIAYAGGVGDQAAAVYHGKETLLAPLESPGAVNTALRLLGVKADGPKDEFDTVGLRGFSDSYDYFEDDSP